jgi:hypothetical protein
MGRSARFRLVGLLVGAALSGLLACSENTTMSFDESNSGATAVVTPGESFEVTLGFIGGSGYGGPDISSSAVVYKGSTVVSPANPGGPTMRFQFQAVAPGTAIITIPTISPAGVEMPAPFTLNVTVH